MTTANTPKSTFHFRLPDAPRSPDEKMTASQHLSLNGNAHYLALHLGNPDTTLVGSDRYITPVPTAELPNMTDSLYPDLLVAFNVDPAAYLARNGYVISEQGKPPDFVLEVASRSTGRRDIIDKRIAYAQLGIPEYWRFDETGQYHGTPLAGDRLTDGRYVPIEIAKLPDGSLQGYSAILNVALRWTNGRLGWHDPDTGQHLPTIASERQAVAEERAARVQAEARVHELEEQLRQLRGACSNPGPSRPAASTDVHFTTRYELEQPDPGHPVT